MNLEPVKAINEIARFAAPKIINQVQRNEIVIKILKTLNLDPANPPKDFDGVYAYALVEYGVGKSAPIWDFFREKEIKTSFWKAFNNNPGNIPKLRRLHSLQSSTSITTFDQTRARFIRYKIDLLRCSH
jgi:hypothetical protein